MSFWKKTRFLHLVYNHTVCYIISTDNRRHLIGKTVILGFRAGSTLTFTALFAFQTRIQVMHPTATVAASKLIHVCCVSLIFYQRVMIRKV